VPNFSLWGFSVSKTTYLFSYPSIVTPLFTNQNIFDANVQCFPNYTKRHFKIVHHLSFNSHPFNYSTLQRIDMSPRYTRLSLPLFDHFGLIHYWSKSFLYKGLPTNNQFSIDNFLHWAGHLWVLEIHVQTQSRVLQSIKFLLLGRPITAIVNLIVQAECLLRLNLDFITQRCQ